jgi:hypothetical protein
MASNGLVGPIAPLSRHLDCFLAESVRCGAACPDGSGAAVLSRWMVDVL